MARHGTGRDVPDAPAHGGGFLNAGPVQCQRSRCKGGGAWNSVPGRAGWTVRASSIPRPRRWPAPGAY